MKTKDKTKLKDLPKKYHKFIKQIRLVCKRLYWKLSLDSELAKNWGVEDGISISIDGIDYIIGFTEDTSCSGTSGFYVSTEVTDMGDRDTPPSSDEKVLVEAKYQQAERLVMPLMDVHWKERRNWVAEELQGIEEMESQKEAEEYMDELQKRGEA